MLGDQTGHHWRYGPAVAGLAGRRGGLRDLQTLYWMARDAFGITDLGQLADPSGPGGALITEHEARLARRAAGLHTPRFGEADPEPDAKADVTLSATGG